MPTDYTGPKNFGGIHSDPKKLEKVPITISSELKSHGRAATKDKNGTVLTEEQFANAQIVDASLAGLSAFASSFSIPMPAVIQQGSEGSCVAQATAYYTLSAEWYKAKGATSYSNTVNVFSSEYLYDQTKTNCFDGSSPITAFDFIKYNGCVLFNTLPYSWTNGCDHTPTAPELAEAALYKINSYSRILASDTAAMKALLSQGHPLVFLWSPDNNFMNAGPGYIWNSSNVGPAVGPHCSALVGWDDSKNAWKLVNSWGTNWADAGYGYIDYELWPIQVADLIYVSGIVDTYSPVADCGGNKVIPYGTTLILDGTASHDVGNGYLTSYLWTNLSGPSTPTITNATSPVASVTGLLSTGTLSNSAPYQFQLTVTDNESNTSTSYMNCWVSGTTPVDTYTLTVSKTSSKGKITDKLIWSISTSSPVISASIEYSASSTGGFTTKYDIIPYSFYGGYSYLVNTKNTRYYRLRVLKSNGTTVYSSVVSIK